MDVHKYMIEYLKDTFQLQHIQFADHHAFNTQDIQEIHQKFDTFAIKNKIILTTEKDYMYQVQSEQQETLQLTLT